MKRVQIKFVRRADCYISLPESLANNISQEYNDRVISRVIKINILDERINGSKILFVGYNGLKSTNQNELEISGVFAELNGLTEGSLVEVEPQPQGEVKTKLGLQCVRSADYEVENTEYLISFKKTYIIFLNIR